MKLTLIAVFLFTSIIGNSQHMFPYEQPVDSIQNYIEEEINVVSNPDNILISGSLIAPKKGFDKIVIIVPGSGKDTRHSHFILAERLLRRGIGVFRFDERGTGKSQANYSELAASLSQDLIACYTSLNEKYPDKKIGVIGHSLGGIAALDAIQKGFTPDFLILIETPVIKNGAYILHQISMDYENRLPQIMRKGKSKDELLTFLTSYFNFVARDLLLTKSEVKKFIRSQGFDGKFIALMDDDFLIEMLHTNHEATVRRIGCRTLFLTGTGDKVINHSEEVGLIKSFNNSNIIIEVFDGLNHWLTKKGAAVGTSLYLMDEAPLQRIIDWTVGM